MFKIEYEIISKQPEEAQFLTDEDIQYDFLLGNVSLFSSDASIEMNWEWIPLLDFAYSLQLIVSNFKENDTAKDFFDFTENAEKLEFSKRGEKLKIAATFSPAVIDTTFADFEKAVGNLHLKISQYIRGSFSGELPSVLKKYLSVEF